MEGNWGEWPPHDLAWADGSGRASGRRGQRSKHLSVARPNQGVVCLDANMGGGSVPGGGVSSWQKHRVERAILPPLTIWLGTGCGKSGTQFSRVVDVGLRADVKTMMNGL